MDSFCCEVGILLARGADRLEKEVGSAWLVKQAQLSGSRRATWLQAHARASATFAGGHKLFAGWPAGQSFPAAVRLLELADFAALVADALGPRAAVAERDAKAAKELLAFLRPERSFPKLEAALQQEAAAYEAAMTEHEAMRRSVSGLAADGRKAAVRLKRLQCICWFAWWRPGASTSPTAWRKEVLKATTKKWPQPWAMWRKENKKTLRRWAKKSATCNAVVAMAARGHRAAGRTVTKKPLGCEDPK